MSQFSASQRIAAGIHSPPAVSSAMAAVQAAWRFYANPRIDPPMLGSPLIDEVRRAVPECCARRLLVVCDWSHLHYKTHASKQDRVTLSRRQDLGYELFTALAVGDRDGHPVAPLCVQLRAGDGLHTTRSKRPLEAPSKLDGLQPVMDHVAGLSVGKPCVFVIDREADSVGHYRAWIRSGHAFVVRARDNRFARHNGREKPLGEIADGLRAAMKRGREVQIHGKPARQFVAETTVVLDRAATPQRLDPAGRKVPRKAVAGPAVVLRLVVAEVRDAQDKTLARWLLLGHVPDVTRGEVTPGEVTPDTIALWYYWRWRIEPYHKLLKSAGQQVEQWQQETARALFLRLIVTAMSAAIVWRIERDTSAEGRTLQATLVRLSGRQMKRTQGSRGATAPALLAGLTVMIPMLILLETMSPEDLHSAAEGLMPLVRSAFGRRKDGS